MSIYTYIAPTQRVTAPEIDLHLAHPCADSSVSRPVLGRTARTEIFPSLIQRDSMRPYAVDDVPMAVAPQGPLLGGWQPPQIQAQTQAKPP